MQHCQHSTRDGKQLLDALHSALAPFHALLKMHQPPRLPQAPISNFLKRKRALSLESLDRVMKAQGPTVEQVLPVDLAADATEEEVHEQVEEVPIVSPSAAIHDAQILAVIETEPVVRERLDEDRGAAGAAAT